MLDGALQSLQDREISKTQNCDKTPSPLPVSRPKFSMKARNPAEHAAALSVSKKSQDSTPISQRSR